MIDSVKLSGIIKRVEGRIDFIERLCEDIKQTVCEERYEEITKNYIDTSVFHLQYEKTFLGHILEELNETVYNKPIPQK